MADLTLLRRPLQLSPGEAARYYAEERGWHVFPCAPRSKSPATRRGFYDATASSGQIASWWEKSPGYNAAIRTGEGSGFFVLDPDGLAGQDEVRALEAIYGPLPKTLTAKTPNGYHHYFRYPAGRRITNSPVSANVHVRGEGGYVVAPPSIHPSGVTYEWVDESVPITDAPDWLLALVSLKSRKRTEGKPAAARWREDHRPRVVLTSTKPFRSSDPSAALWVLPEDLKPSTYAVATALAQIASRRLRDGDSVSFSLLRLAAGRDLVRRHLAEQGTCYSRGTVAAALRELVGRDVLRREGQLRPDLRRREQVPDGAYVYSLAVQVTTGLRELMRRELDRLRDRQKESEKNARFSVSNNIGGRVGSETLVERLSGALRFCVRTARPGNRNDLGYWFTRLCIEVGLCEDETRRWLRSYHAEIDDPDFPFYEIEKSVRSAFKIHVYESIRIGR